jgi:hypothetical protein
LNLISFKYLRSAGIKPILSNICYPVWELSLTEEKPAARKASKAVLINRDIALMSASWGRFQIMGFNFKAWMQIHSRICQ